ncbi:hypothetical protein [Absidia glauca]|uniref:Nitrogen regulatory protein areA GATA-like domain-containing protein n=1 Tax=Absidia glauca TaxID=4829 RepID=A0A168NEI2_ABSGL|nr:hypothetical protein [Absidia glauca]
MLQRLDIPILSLNTPAHVTHKDTGDVHADSFLWSVFKKCANSLEKDRRQENLNWRLWRRGSGQSSTLTSSSSLTIDGGDTWSNCSSYTSTPAANTLLNESFNTPAPKFCISEFENEAPIHADQQQGDDTKDWQLDGGSDDDEDEDDDMTLFGDDTHWSCCEFKKTPPPVVDQRSLLSNMLLQCPSPRAGSSSSSSSSSSQPMAPSSSTFVEKDDLLSSSMKRYVQWEKKQNSGPAAGLMVAPCPSPSSFMIHRDSFDTFRGCW